MTTGLVMALMSGETAVLGSVFLLLLVLGLYDGRFLATMSILLFAAQMLNRGVVPDRGMFMAAGATGLALFLGVLRGRMPNFNVLRGGIFPAVLAYLMLGLVTIGASVDSGRTFTALLATIAAAMFAWMLISAAEPEEIRFGIRWSMGLLMLLSVYMLVARRDIAVVGLASRWRGATDNANTLAIMSSFFFLSARTTKSQLAGLPATVLMLLGTAGRTATLGLAIVTGPGLLRKRSRVVRRSLLIGALLLSIPLLFSVFFVEGSQEVNVADGSLTRLDNSRADSWGTATESIRNRPLTGIGVGNDRSLSDEGLPVHSSILRPIVEVGLLALIPLGLIVLAGIRSIRQRSSPFRSIFGFMVILGLFEGWLFAGGSVFFVMFMITSYLAAHPGPDFDGDPEADADADADADFEPDHQAATRGRWASVTTGNATARGASGFVA